MLVKQKLQVFVSSTYNDLIEERQTAVSAILKLGHIPAGMELFAAGDQSQMDVIKRWIDESDIYMLILGGRYGSIEKASGLSYTELEYDYAVAQGKPLFALVMSDDALDSKIKSKGRMATELDRPDALKTFRTKVMSKMCSIYLDNKDIRGGVYESILEIMQTRALLGWVPAALLEDTRALQDKIARLQMENDRMSVELDELNSKQTSNNHHVDERISVLIDLMKSSILIIPAEISTAGKEIVRTQHDYLLNHRNLFVRGWSIGQNPSERTQWFLDHHFTFLRVHRLIDSEKLPNGLTRYTATEQALDYFAAVDQAAMSRDNPGEAKLKKTKNVSKK